MKQKATILFSFIPGILLAGILGVSHLKISSVASGDLIKGSYSAVYYLGADNKRYVFPNDKAYFSWYTDFLGVKTVSDSELASYQLGGNVTYRPGTRLVKIQSDPKVYAVGAGGVLHWVNSESIANAIFGADWGKKVDDIADAFFINYSVGAPVALATDYNPAALASADSSINVDKGLNTAPDNNNSNTNTNTNTNVNAPVAASCSPTCTLGNACVLGQCQVVPGPSPVTVKAFIIDSADVCFVGDPCVTGGSCCSVAGNQFADNENFKVVRPVDKYLYAAEQQFCEKATLSSGDRNRITSALNTFADNVAAQTSNRLTVSVGQTRISGEFTMSRVPGSCDWWISPNDLRDRLSGQIDNTTDAVFVIGSRTFGSATISSPDSKTVDQTLGLAGAGYSYFNKEWETNTSGIADPSIYSTAFSAQMSSSLDLGITNPSASYIGNHCRDGKKDIDETGVDCGGTVCNACY